MGVGRWHTVFRTENYADLCQNTCQESLVRLLRCLFSPLELKARSAHNPGGRHCCDIWWNFQDATGPKLTPTHCSAIDDQHHTIPLVVSEKIITDIFTSAVHLKNVPALCHSVLTVYTDMTLVVYVKGWHGWCRVGKLDGPGPHMCTGSPCLVHSLCKNSILRLIHTFLGTQ